MYFNMFGGSALLHVLAAYPKTAAGVGIAATLAMLGSPIGRGDYAGLERYARSLDAVAASYSDVDDATLDVAARATRRLEAMPAETIDQAVRAMLSSCGDGCAQLTPAILESNPKLLTKALFIFELNEQGEQR